MEYLVEMKLAGSGRPSSFAEGVAFIEQFILPTLEMCQKLQTEKKIRAGGPISGSIALALIVQAESNRELDQVVEGLPVWPMMETTITPLISFEDRERALRSRLEHLKTRLPNK